MIMIYGSDRAKTRQHTAYNSTGGRKTPPSCLWGARSCEIESPLCEAAADPTCRGPRRGVVRAPQARERRKSAVGASLESERRALLQQQIQVRSSICVCWSCRRYRRLGTRLDLLRAGSFSIIPRSSCEISECRRPATLTPGAAPPQLRFSGCIS